MAVEGRASFEGKSVAVDKCEGASVVVAEVVVEWSASFLERGAEIGFFLVGVTSDFGNLQRQMIIHALICSVLFCFLKL